MENHVSTTICVPLSGSNHTVYLITVNAVNVVGSGVNTSGTCTPTKHALPSGIHWSHVYIHCSLRDKYIIRFTIFNFLSEKFITRYNWDYNLKASIYLCCLFIRLEL